MITIFLHIVLISAGAKTGEIGMFVALWFLLVWDVVLALNVLGASNKNQNQTNDYLHKRNQIEKKIEKEYGIIDFTEKEE